VDQGVQAASHQRQLSLKYSEIQQRLIDNQSLLNSLEKAGGACSLENLLAELKLRVEQDKEALRQWTALRKSTSGPSNAKNPPLAARLLQFSRGCALALQFMNEDNPQVGRNYTIESRFENARMKIRSSPNFEEKHVRNSDSRRLDVDYISFVCTNIACENTHK
jgi:hypothetical protein